MSPLNAAICTTTYSAPSVYRPPVLSPNSPIANILVCPDFRHYKYPVILPNSATAIRYSFSDTKVVKSI